MSDLCERVAKCFAERESDNGGALIATDGAESRITCRGRGARFATAEFSWSCSGADHDDEKMLAFVLERAESIVMVFPPLVR